MGKKRKKGKKSNLLPLLAIGAGIFLLTRNKYTTVIPPLTDPGKDQVIPPAGTGTTVGRLWPRYIPTII